MVGADRGQSFANPIRSTGQARGKMGKDQQKKKKRREQMGWMGIPMDKKPDSRELTNILTERMERNGYTIIDRSG